MIHELRFTDRTTSHWLIKNLDSRDETDRFLGLFT